ncbi:MGMT family protein [Crenobacter caeni]|nr:MGMT family protein [Crenobacter caeni]
MDAGFAARVADALEAVPAGRVTSYGALAAAAGWPRHARHVARVLKAMPDLPWQRVVHADGSLARPGSEQHDWQHALLEHEGVAFLPSGRVDLQRCGWPLSDDAMPASMTRS